MSGRPGRRVCTHFSRDPVQSGWSRSSFRRRITEGFRIAVDAAGEVAFRWPAGRPFPQAPPAPRWARPPLAPTDARLAADGSIRIGPATATPHWHGERLDLGYAMDVLWTPRAGAGGAGASARPSCAGRS